MLLHERAFQILGNSNLHSPTSSLQQAKHPPVSFMLLLWHSLAFSDRSGYLPLKCSEFWCPELTIILLIWLNNVNMCKSVSSFELDTISTDAEKENKLWRSNHSTGSPLAVTHALTMRLHFKPEGTPLPLAMGTLHKASLATWSWAGVVLPDLTFPGLFSHCLRWAEAVCDSGHSPLKITSHLSWHIWDKLCDFGWTCPWKYSHFPHIQERSCPWNEAKLPSHFLLGPGDPTLSTKPKP